MSYGYLGNLKEQVKIICSTCFTTISKHEAKCSWCGAKNVEYLKFAKYPSIS